MRTLCTINGSKYSQWEIQALKAIVNRELEQVTLLHVADMSSPRALTGTNASKSGPRGLSQAKHNRRTSATIEGSHYRHGIARLEIEATGHGTGYHPSECPLKEFIKDVFPVVTQRSRWTTW